MLSYASSTGRAALDAFDRSGDNLVLRSVWTDSWQPGWKGFAILRVDAGVEYIACHPVNEECSRDRIDADGTLSTLARMPMTFRTDDVKTLGPMPYRGDGTASFVVRNGDLWTELVFGETRAIIDAARMRRPVAGAAFDVTADGIHASGRLLAMAAAGGAPSGPLSWSIREDGAAIGTAAMQPLSQQIVTLPADLSQNDPPTAFKFPTLWGSRIGGAAAYGTSIVTNAGPVDVYVDPFFPAYAYGKSQGLLKSFLSTDTYVRAAKSVERVWGDPDAPRTDIPVDASTVITFRGPDGISKGQYREPGFVRASPIPIIGAFGSISPHILMQKANGETVILRVAIGSAGQFDGLTEVYRETWAHPWSTFRVFHNGGERYLYSYANATGRAAVDHIVLASDGRITLEPLWSKEHIVGLEGFAPLSLPGANLGYVACSFKTFECVIEQIDADFELTTVHRMTTGGRIAPLLYLAPGPRSESGMATLVGWRGGWGWIEMQIGPA